MGFLDFLWQRPITVIGQQLYNGSQYIGQAAAPVIRQGVQYAGQVGQVLARPPAAVAVQAIQRTPQYQQLTRAAVPVARQVVQTIHRNPQMLGMSAVPVMLGGTIARAAAPVAVPAVRQAAQILARPPIETFGPAVVRLPQMIGRTVAPAVASAIRTASSVLTRSPIEVIAPAVVRAPSIIARTAAPYIRLAVQTVQRNPQMLGMSAVPVMLGGAIARAAAPVAVPVVRQASGVLSQSPIRFAVSQVARLPQARTFLTSGAEIFRQTPLAPVVAAGQRFQAWGGLNRLNPIPSARGAEVQPMGSGTALASSWRQQGQGLIDQTNAITGQYGIQQVGIPGGSGPSATSWQSPIQSSSWTSGGQADTDVFGRLGRFDILGALGAAGNVIGGLRPNVGPVSGGSPQWNNQSWQASTMGPNGQVATSWGTSSNWTSETRTGPQARANDGSMDVWGKLTRGDVAGAAEAGANWITNVPMNFVNLQIGRLERQEIPILKGYDDWVRSGRESALTKLEANRPAPGSLDEFAWNQRRQELTGPGQWAGTFKGLGGQARVFSNDLLGVIGTGVLFGIAGGARFAGDVGTQPWNRDVGGAASTVATGAANTAIGTVQWGLGIPGRIAADPQRGTAQVLGEFVAGDLLFGGAGRAVRGAKGATVQTVGRPLGLLNPDVLVTKGKIGVPQDAPVRQVESILSSPYSYSVIHTSRQPLSLNPVRGKIFAEAGEGANVPKQFFTYGNERTGVTSDIFYTRKLSSLPLSVRASNLVFGPRINLVPRMRNVDLPSGLRSTALSEMRTRGALTEGTYRRIESHAMEQSARYGEPIFMPSPKRMKPQISRIENEGIAVFGNDAARTISAHQFGGYTAGGVKVSRVAFGNQVLPTGRIGYMAKNARSSFDYGFSPSAGARSLGLFHRPSLEYRADLANYKIDVLTGKKQVSPQERQFDGRGQAHMRDVEAGLAWERRVNPVVRANLSPAGARIMALTEDAGKFWAQDPMYPSGRLAAIGLERGMFPAVSRQFSRLPRPEQRAITRGLVQHNAISPSVFPRGIPTTRADLGLAWKGLRTKVIGPDAVGMALFNANQAPGAATFASAAIQRRGMGSRIFSGQLGVIEPGLAKMMSRKAAVRSDIAPWMEIPEYLKGRGLGETVADLRTRGRKGEWEASSLLPDGSIYRSSSRYGGRTRQVRGPRDQWTGTDLEPWMRPPKGVADLLRGRARSRTYEPRRAGSGYLSYGRRGRSGLSPFAAGYVSEALESRPSFLSYGLEKPSYGRSYAPEYGAVSEGFQAYGKDLYGRAAKYGGAYGDGYSLLSGGYGYGDRYKYGGGYRSGYGGYGGYGYGGRYQYGGGGYPGYGYGGRYQYGSGGYGGYGYGGRYLFGGGGYGGYGYGGRYQSGGGGYFRTGSSITTGGGSIITTGGWFSRTRTGQPWDRPTPPPGEGNQGARHGGRAAYDFMEMTGIDDPESILKRGAKRGKGQKGKRTGAILKLPKIGKLGRLRL